MPMEIINTILSYDEKEYYWNRFTKQWRIRFIRKYLDSKFAYLFENISTTNDINSYTYEINISRKEFSISMYVMYLVYDEVFISCYMYFPHVYYWGKLCK